MAQTLLARALDDAPARGASAIEAYPLLDGVGFSGFRGPRTMYDANGFTEVMVRQRDSVVRRAV